MHVAEASSEVAGAVAQEVGEGYVAITCDALAAAMAADAGALALDDHGLEHADPWEFVARRERMREEGTPSRQLMVVLHGPGGTTVPSSGTVVSAPLPGGERAPRPAAACANM